MSFYDLYTILALPILGISLLCSRRDRQKDKIKAIRKQTKMLLKKMNQRYFETQQELISEASKAYKG